MVADFNHQADPKAAHTYVYDYLPHKQIKTADFLILCSWF